MQRIITLVLFIGIQASLIGQDQVPKLQLFEEFTNASCIPCAAQNPGYNALIDLNRDHVVSLKYQTDFPGYDPMNTHIPNDLENRYNLYSNYHSEIVGVPSATINGILPSENYANGLGNFENAYPGAPAGFNQPMIDFAVGDSSSISIELSHELYAQNDSIAIDLKLKNLGDNSILGDNRLFVILTERTIDFPCGAPGSNGESVFYDIAREFITGPNGQRHFRIGAGDSIVQTYYRPIPDYIYDKSEVGVVAFLQDIGDLTVYNSAVSYPDSLDYFVDARLFPRDGSNEALCDPEYVPTVNIENIGWDSIHSVELIYSFGSQQQSKSFSNLNLATGDNVDLQFDTAMHPGGSFQIQYDISQVNGGGTDGNSLNNFPCFPFYAKKVTDPGFDEGEQEYDFESDPAGFTPVRYNVDAEQSLVFRVVNNDILNEPRSVGYRSDNGVIVDFYNWPVDSLEQTAEMVLIDRLDFTYVVNAELRMNYFKGIQLSNPSLGDSLAIQYSLDCGDSWNTLWQIGGASMQTTRNRVDRFEIPQFSSDWEELELPLDTLEGEADVLLRFQAINGGDNTLMLDNIEITGEDITNAREAFLSQNISLYPNPLQIGDPLYLEARSGIKLKQVSIFNASGQLINKQKVESIFNRVIMPNQEGMYFIQMKTEQGIITERVMLMK